MVEVAHNVMINASYIPSKNLAEIVRGMSDKQALFDGEEVIAFTVQEDEEVDFDTYECIQYTAPDILRIAHTWDLFSKNSEAIARDFELLTEGRTSQPVPETTMVLNDGAIFIEEGAKLPLCSLNAEGGPIYIGKDAEIMEGSMIRLSLIHI